MVVKDIERKHRVEISALKQEFDTEIKSVKNAATATEETLKRTIDSLTSDIREQNERLIKLEIKCEEKNRNYVESESVGDESNLSAETHIERGGAEKKQKTYQSGNQYDTSSKR